MPSYVKKIIESGMRTLSISDYPVPQFEIGKAPAGAKIKTSSVIKKEEKPDVDLTEKSDLPKPQKAAIKEEEEKTDEVEEKIESEEPEKKDKISAATPKITPPPTTIKTKEGEDKEDDEIEALLESLKSNDDEKVVEEKEKVKKVDETKKVIPEKTKKLIKNKNQTKTMLKMIFVTLAVFFATVAVGIGIGLGVLQLTQPSTTEEPLSPIVEVSPSPSPSPSPSVSPNPEIDTANLSILVVNATTKAGYAGEIADKLTDFDTVKAGNAKGDYEPGLYVLMAEDNQALITVLESATEQKYTFKEKEEIEDPQNQYDAVIVLAE
jgi:hypothetical protein